MKYLSTQTSIGVLILALILGIVAFSISLHRNRSHFPNTVVMKYSDFGSLSGSDVLLGSDSSQGNGESGGAPRNKDEIQVVVYRNVDLATGKRTYPALGGKYDYRYVEYSEAMDYLDKQIEELKANNNRDPAYNKLKDKLVSEYEQSRSKIIERLGP